MNVCKSCGLEYTGYWSAHAARNEHFLARLRRTESGCWEWQGTRNRKGYGQYAGEGTHRVAWRKFVGPIPAGMLVCHTCDNPPCCNPEHLWLGTVLENNRDRDSKGRHARSKGVCKNGHPYGPPRADGWHLCRICVRERSRGYIRPSRRKAA